MLEPQAWVLDPAQYRKAAFKQLSGKTNKGDHEERLQRNESGSIR